MANRVTEIGRILRAGDIELARRRVRRAIERAEGNVTAAGRKLGVDDNTIFRWVHRLALERVVDEARRKRDEARASASTRVDTGAA